MPVYAALLSSEQTTVWKPFITTVSVSVMSALCTTNKPPFAPAERKTFKPAKWCAVKSAHSFPVIAAKCITKRAANSLSDNATHRETNASTIYVSVLAAIRIALHSTHWQTFLPAQCAPIDAAKCSPLASANFKPFISAQQHSFYSTVCAAHNTACGETHESANM